MPLSRLWARLERVAKRRELERNLEEQRWILGQWMQARTLYHALTSDKALPPTKAEHNRKKPDWTAIARARKARIKHDKRWTDALGDPKKFGALMRFPHILGEPEPEPEEGFASGDEMVKDFFERLGKRMGAAS